MIVDISDRRLANAQNFDLIPCNPSSEDFKERAFAEFGIAHSILGERCGADLYVDAIGHKAALDNFTSVAGYNAALSIVGVHHAQVDIDLKSMFRQLAHRRLWGPFHRRGAARDTRCHAIGKI